MLATMMVAGGLWVLNSGLAEGACGDYLQHVRNHDSGMENGRGGSEIGSLVAFGEPQEDGKQRPCECQGGQCRQAPTLPDSRGPVTRIVVEERGWFSAAISVKSQEGQDGGDGAEERVVLAGGYWPEIERPPRA